MAEKDQKDKDKDAVEKLKADYGAEDLGTYMDARVDGKPIRVAVWNEGLKSYQPTPEGLELLNTPKPEKPKAETKPAAKPAAGGGAGIATPVPPAPPPGQGPVAAPPPPPPPPAGTKPPNG